jgi:hypothetical protein
MSATSAAPWEPTAWMRGAIGRRQVELEETGVDEWCDAGVAVISTLVGHSD